MRSILRRAIKAIKSVNPDIQVEVLSQAGHIKLKLTLGDRVKRLTMSGSPGSDDVAIQNVVRDTRIYLIEGRGLCVPGEKTCE